MRGRVASQVPSVSLSQRRGLLLQPIQDADHVRKERHSLDAIDIAIGLTGLKERYQSGNDTDSDLLIGDVKGCTVAVQLKGDKPEKHMNLELHQVLGSGSLATVRLGQQISDGKIVAVKCSCSEEAEVRQFIRAEYALLQLLDHPSVIQAEALYECGRNMWLCVEYCNSGSVQQCVEKTGTFDEHSVQWLAKQLFEGIDYLHQKRVVHRDIKPANLLLKNPSKLLKIADFNSATRVGESSGNSFMLSDRGTHLYSAPEFRFGRLWNERVDIWASGLSIFFMVQGRLPFNPERRSVARSLLLGELPKITWLDIPALLRNLVQQSLTVNMYDRPTAMELLLHPIFDGTRLDQDGVNVRSSNVDSCAVGSHTAPTRYMLSQFMLLPACGLISVRNSSHGIWLQCSSSVVDAHVSSGGTPEQCDSPDTMLCGWRERRGKDSLQRLMVRRVSRTMENNPTLLEFRAHKESRHHRRFFTTHGAAQNP